MARLGHARRHTAFAAIITLAAAALLLSPLALMSAWVYAESLPTQIYSTAVGEIRPIVLDRWISLWMNTDSAAEVRPDDSDCNVGLDHGEALFEVKGGSPRSLHVVVGDTVMGTRAATFSVRLRDTKNMELVVRTGQVTVGTTVVSEHQWVRISPDGMRVRDLEEVEVARRLEWTNGRLTFVGETLAEAVAEFNRYNTRKLVIAERSIGFIPIGGKFRVSDVQSFVAALGALGVRSTVGDQNNIQLTAAKGAN